MMNGKKKGRIRAAAVLLGAAVLLCGGFAAAEEARNIAAECTYRCPEDSGRNTGDLYDGSYSRFWQSAGAADPWLEVTLPDGETCSGVQIKWQTVHPKYLLVQAKFRTEQVKFKAVHHR